MSKIYIVTKRESGKYEEDGVWFSILAAFDTRNKAEECKVPLHTVHNWSAGACRIPELAKDKIEEVTGVKIFHSENQ